MMEVLVLNFAFPWAYIAVGNAFGFNDYKKEDTSVNSSIIRSDVTHTFDIMLQKQSETFFQQSILIEVYL